MPRHPVPAVARLRPAAVAVLLAWQGGAWSQQSYAPDAAVPWPRLKYERALREDAAGQSPAMPSYARARSISGDDQRVVLEGDAEIRRGGTVLRGDRIVYTQATDEVEATGNARVLRSGADFRAPWLTFKVDAQTGSMPETDYTYAPRNGRGSATLVEFLGENRARLDNASFTTCRPGDDAWWVRAERLDIDSGDEAAIARGARVYFQDVPILASPYFSFPLGERRRSGFLTPRFGINNNLGTDIALPYYFDLAPNYDYTLTPRIMSRRGIMLGNEFRYLQPEYKGTWVYDVIPDDRVYGGMRDALSLRHEYSSPKGWTGGVNYNRVSDNTFLSDFSTSIVQTSQTVLPQEAWVGYNQALWNAAVRVTKNQTLTLPNVDIVKPYERVPEVTVNSLVADWKGLELGSWLNSTQFDHPTLVTGNRSIVNPRVAYPVIAPGWFVVPRAQYLATWYNLTPGSTPVTNVTSDNQYRGMPIGSVDAGLIFERPASWFGRASTQTLEPRLYYAYIPYRDQSTLPNFDSAVADFNFAQLFTENVYSGWDRIGEANQLSMALTTRVLDNETGEERLRAAIGQRYYFAEQRVTLPGVPARDANTSDFLAQITGYLGREWAADAGIQYSSQLSEVLKAIAGVRWQPRPASVLGVYYRYRYKEFNQIDIAGQWPLSASWYAVGRFNYALKQANSTQQSNKPIEALAGIEYKADCWVIRAVGQSFVTTSQSRSTSFFIQLELNGLGGIGISPLEALKRNIPGYQMINPIPRTPGQFEFYE